MKKILLFIIACICTSWLSAQFIYKIKADSVLITNDSCTAELNLENKTKDTLGFLFNKGRGRTEFRRGIIKLTDSTSLIGADTIKLINASNASNGLTKTGNLIQLGGPLTKNTLISNLDSSLTFQFANGSYQKIGNLRGYTGRVEQYGKGRFQSYAERSVNDNDWWDVSFSIDTLGKTYGAIATEAPGEAKFVVGNFTTFNGYNPFPSTSGNNTYRLVLSNYYGFFMDNYPYGPIFGVDLQGKLSLFKSPEQGTSTDSILVWDATSKNVKKIAQTVPSVSQSKSISLQSPTASENVTMWYTTQAITIEAVRGVMLGSSQSVTMTLNYGSSRATATGTIIASNTFDSGDSGYQTTGFAFNLNTTSIPANSYIWLTTSATSGTINDFNITITYR